MSRRLDIRDRQRELSWRFVLVSLVKALINLKVELHALN